jgi:hypothetical protein
VPKARTGEWLSPLQLTVVGHNSEQCGMAIITFRLNGLDHEQRVLADGIGSWGFDQDRHAMPGRERVQSGHLQVMGAITPWTVD